MSYEPQREIPPNPPNIYVFIISSLNHPIYRTIHHKRQKLLDYYGIPYTVLLNQAETSVFDTSETSTLTPLEHDEVLFQGDGYNPFMAQKFLNAVKILFRSYRCFQDVPDYIVRLNATVYVHFPSLLHYVASPSFPREKVLAGEHVRTNVDPHGQPFAQGIMMIFSKDVLWEMLHSPKMYDKSVMRYNDDVSLSIIALDFARIHDTNHHRVSRTHETSNLSTGLYDMEKLNALERKDTEFHSTLSPPVFRLWYFRIHSEDEEKDPQRLRDVQNWDILAEYFNEDPILRSTQTTSLHFYNPHIPSHIPFSHPSQRFCPRSTSHESFLLESFPTFPNYTLHYSHKNRGGGYLHLGSL